MRTVLISSIILCGKFSWIDNFHCFGQKNQRYIFKINFTEKIGKPKFCFTLTLIIWTVCRFRLLFHLLCNQREKKRLLQIIDKYYMKTIYWIYWNIAKQFISKYLKFPLQFFFNILTQGDAWGRGALRPLLLCFFFLYSKINPYLIFLLIPTFCCGCPYERKKIKFCSPPLTAPLGHPVQNYCYKP